MSEETPRTRKILLKHSTLDDAASDIRCLERENNELRENYNRILEEQREAFECDRKALLEFRDGTWHGRTTKDYTDSVSVDPNEETPFFSLAYQWQDKKHRHVFDLCDWINKLQDELKEAK